jgi:hypothetical protein
MSARPAVHPVAVVLVLGLAVGLPGCATTPPPPAVESPAEDKPMTVRGQLTTEGVECPAMRGADGTLYTLLGDLGEFKPGDKVVVEGTPVAISFCMQGTTIQITRIARQD